MFFSKASSFPGNPLPLPPSKAAAATGSITGEIGVDLAGVVVVIVIVNVVVIVVVAVAHSSGVKMDIGVLASCGGETMNFGGESGGGVEE